MTKSSFFFGYTKQFLLGGLLFCIPFSGVFAGHGDNCDVNMIENGIYGEISPETNWATQMLFEGDDGFLWKRAVITSHSEEFPLQEGQITRIYGVAEPYSKVQVLMFPRVDNDPNDYADGVQPPSSIDGICIEATQTNNEGYFFLNMNDRNFWGNMGEDLVFDAFYRTNILWEEFIQKYSQDTNMNIFIGSHVFPRVLSMGGDLVVPEDCAAICEGLTEGVVLDPTRLDDQLRGQNFSAEPISEQKVTIGRIPNSHTFYSSVEGGDRSEAEVLALRTITQKAIVMEIVKRRLLGNQNVRGTPMGLRAITGADIMNAYLGGNGVGVSDETHQLIQGIRALMIDEDETLPIDNNLNLIQSQGWQVYAAPGFPPPEPPVNAMPDVTLPPTLDYPNEPPRVAIPEKPGPIITRGEILFVLQPILNLADPPEENLIADLFPLQASSYENWADDFATMLIFWTGRATQNDCLLQDDNLLTLNYEWQEAGEETTQCEYPYVSGNTPTLVLHSSEEVQLEPQFTNTVMTESSRFFTKNSSWFFPRNSEKNLSYEYEFTTAFTEDIVTEACLSESDISGYADALTSHFGLFPKERNALEKELLYGFEDISSSARVRLTHPDSLKNRIQWKGNGEDLSVFQLFFGVSEEECGMTNFGSLPNLNVPQNRDGFEAGLLMSRK